MSTRRINYGEPVRLDKADRLGSVFFESTALFVYSFVN